LKSLDYKQIPPIPYRKTVSLVNNFVINTTEFLNKFSYLCEQKLSKVTSEIERLEITLNILEAKLASIPGLEGAVQAAAAEEVPSMPVAPSYQSAPISNGGGRDSEEDPEEEAGSQVVEAPRGSFLKVKDDPRFKSYFTLLRVGAPLTQVKMQMKAHGMDPTVLDDPDAEAPPMEISEMQNGGESPHSVEDEAHEDGPPLPPPLQAPVAQAEDSEESSSEED